MGFLADLRSGIARHPWKTLEHAFACFSVIFTLARAVTYFLPPVKIEGPKVLTAAAILSVVYALWKAWKPSRIEIALANCNTVIEIAFGDLFEQDGIRVIAVSEFFDSKLGLPVSEKSVHGIFLKKCFGGHPEPFNKQLDEQLKGVQSQQVAKAEGKSKSYPIGPTALITANQDRYIVFASTKADPNTCKVFSDVAMLWKALEGLWQRLRVEAGGDVVNLPLIGSGLSGLGVPARDLLNLIVLSAITETKSKQVAQRIRIVLHQSNCEALDLKEIKRHCGE